MAASYLKDILRSKPNVENIEVIDFQTIQLDVTSIESLGKSSRKYVIYMPSNDDYEVTVDIVNKAREAGANLIVCDAWIHITYAGKEYGRKIGVNVYSIGAFLHRIESGEKL